MAQNNCPLCNKQVECESGPPGFARYLCPCCGDFWIHAHAIFGTIGDMQRQGKLADLMHISAYIRALTERNKRERKRDSTPILVPSSSGMGSIEGGFFLGIDDVLSNAPRSVADRLDKLLITLANMSEYPGAWISIEEKDSPIAYAINLDAFAFMLSQLEFKHFIEADGGMKFPGRVRLTADGWERAIELERGKAGEKPLQAFVAMWFAPKLIDAYEKGIEPAVCEAGYDPKRIDRQQHNNKIDDEIVAQIRMSKFLIADFTGQRGGVYFETGLAMGLGLPVIWTCREDHIKRCHFDTRQYNHITWTTPEELRIKLRQRIEATIGRPPA